VRDFEFLEPSSIEEASRMLAEAGENSRVMAGGTALMLAMRQRMLAPSTVVSVARIAALQGISFDPAQGLRIGALSRHVDVAEADVIKQQYPMLAEMAAKLANPQVRHQGTLGGNICYADPSTDPSTCLIALNAQIVLGSVRGQRMMPLERFLVDYFQTAIEQDELVVEVRVPVLPSGFRGQYRRFRKTAAEHRPLVNIAVAAQLEQDRCQQARIVVGASTPVPQRLKETEALLKNQVIDQALLKKASIAASQEVNAVSDNRASESFRREMVRVNAYRCLADTFGLPQE